MGGQVNLEAVARIMREVADSEVLPRWRALDGAAIHRKGDTDLVTEADLAAERALARRLVGLLPGSVALGEEAVAANPYGLRALDGADPVWVIDPVDGTRGFTRGEADFGMLVALVVGGRTVAGWVLAPVSGTLAMAEAGGGALLDGRAVRLCAPPDEEIGVGGLDPKWLADDDRRLLDARRVLHPGARPHINSSTEFLHLLAGRASFFLTSHVTPWDVAAGAFLQAEAGGVARMLDGTPLSPRALSGCLLLAASERAWSQTAAALLAGRLRGAVGSAFPRGARLG